MKSATITLLLFFLFQINLTAQENLPNTGFGAGFQILQYQKDFGIGINLNSPYFANNRVAFRLKTNFMFLEHLEDGVTTWTPYANFSLGVISVGGNINDKIRLYGEGGIIGILPNDEFSSESVNFGGYGLFGFEFFFYPAGNYFIEIGGVGTGAKADKIETQPIYSNGLIISAGVRFLME